MNERGCDVLLESLEQWDSFVFAPMTAQKVTQVGYLSTHYRFIVDQIPIERVDSTKDLDDACA
jgi:hypothetical protein